VRSYYAIFTSLYSTSLLFSEQTMTNSSWTQAHIKSLLTKGRASWLASLLLFDEPDKERQAAKPDSSQPRGNGACEVVYPPCDTEELVKLGRLDRRERKVVSLAQFR
jgi:alpha-1,2-mannosyltransferase